MGDAVSVVATQLSCFRSPGRLLRQRYRLRHDPRSHPSTLAIEVDPNFAVYPATGLLLKARNVLWNRNRSPRLTSTQAFH
jgi:hypothetical protein